MSAAARSSDGGDVMRAVVKIGTSSITNPLGELDLFRCGQQRIRAGAAQKQLQGVPGSRVGRADCAQLGATGGPVCMGPAATALPGRGRGRRTAGSRPLGGVCSVATRARNGVATLGIKVAQLSRNQSSSMCIEL